MLEEELDIAEVIGAGMCGAHVMRGAQRVTRDPVQGELDGVEDRGLSRTGRPAYEKQAMVDGGEVNRLATHIGTERLHGEHEGLHEDTSSMQLLTASRSSLVSSMPVCCS